MRFFVMIAAVLAAGLAAADGLPDLELSTVTIATSGPLMLPVHPDGGGPAFTAAYAAGGARADATVTLELRDPGGWPIINFPAEDIWLQGLDQGLQPCGIWTGLRPDRSTDDNGRTVWIAAPRAGGNTTDLAMVYVNGMPLASTAGLDLRFTSPDLNGDGAVNLSDGGLFTGHLYLGYDPRADFNHDFVINISDVGLLAEALGRRCP